MEQKQHLLELFWFDWSALILLIQRTSRFALIELFNQGDFHCNTVRFPTIVFAFSVIVLVWGVSDVPAIVAGLDTCQLHCCMCNIFLGRLRPPVALRQGFRACCSEKLFLDGSDLQPTNKKRPGGGSNQ